MEEDKPLLDLVEDLGKDKNAFLFDVKTEVRSFVESQGKDCLTIVERKSDGAVYKRVPMEANLNYVNLLIKFCRGERSSGRQLDSGLTDSIVEKVMGCYVKFYDDNSEQIANAFISALLANQTILRGFVNALTEKLARQAGQQVRDRMVSLIIYQLREAATSQTGSVITASVQHSATSTTTLMVAKTLAALIVKLMSTQLKVIIVKYLSMAAVQKIILIAVKKFVAAAILAAVVKFVAAKLSITTGAAFAIVLLPVIAAFIIHEIRHFPAQLGEKIAASICEELDGKFDSINHSIVTNMFDEMFNLNAEGLVGSIAQHESVRDMMLDLAKGLQQAPA